MKEPEEFADGTDPFVKVEAEVPVLIIRSTLLPKVIDQLADNFDEYDYSALLAFLEYHQDQPDGHFAFAMTKNGGTLIHLR